MKPRSMNCEEVSKELIPYLDRRINSADRRELEDHLLACAACRTRAEEFRALWGVLDEAPAIEPSLGFDARVRQRLAADSKRHWLRWLVPQPRLALSLAALLAIFFWTGRIPSTTVNPTSAQTFEAVKDLNVLENYDVLTKLDALSELTPSAVEESAPGQPAQYAPDQAPDSSGGGS